jgi:hypothetical protein
MITDSYRYIKHKNIDKDKWNRCINASQNAIVYALSWYLDGICRKWSAVILNDYESVMPLIHNRKFFIPYIHNPYFSTRLGIFSKTQPDDDTINDFFSAIPKSFRMVSIKFNSYTILNPSGYKIHLNHTYELNLFESYEALYEGFSKSHKKNIAKAKKSGIEIRKSTAIHDLIRLKKELLRSVNEFKYKESQFKKLSIVLNRAVQNNFCYILSAYDKNETLCAAALFLIKYDRAIKFTATNAAGKANRAGYLLIDRFIQEHAESNLILDFAGSNITGIANFNEGFGSIQCTYPEYYMNRLRFPFSLLKKR